MQCVLQNIDHLLNLELGLGNNGNVALVALKLGIYALKVKAIGNDSIGLVNRIGCLVKINFRYNIKGWHTIIRSCFIACRLSTGSPIFTGVTKFNRF
jgi:hypothetical protein